MFGVRGSPHRLIKADWCLDLPLQSGVIEHIVIGKWLLDHHQFEFIKSFEERDVRERVRGICVPHQTNLRKALAYLADDINIPTGLDLNLDALIAIGEFPLDLLQ